MSTKKHYKVGESYVRPDGIKVTMVNFDEGHDYYSDLKKALADRAAKYTPEQRASQRSDTALDAENAPPATPPA